MVATPLLGLPWHLPVEPQPEIGECAVHGPCTHPQHRTLPASPEHPSFTGGTRSESGVHESGEALERVPIALPQLPLEGVDHFGRISRSIEHRLQVREQPLMTYEPSERGRGAGEPSPSCLSAATPGTPEFGGRPLPWR